ncbi:MAG: hypothetical protein KAZ94_05570, partial [Burkholderiales bacterium]|nr:hypothetical protein [Burkholderiales bacterium]MBP9769839.1 hypothetical protein [Burkholderiales bacterium]
DLGSNQKIVDGGNVHLGIHHLPPTQNCLCNFYVNLDFLSCYWGAIPKPQIFLEFVAKPWYI